VRWGAKVSTDRHYDLLRGHDKVGKTFETGGPSKTSRPPFTTERTTSIELELDFFKRSEMEIVEAEL
jgi:hypothetical protein